MNYNPHSKINQYIIDGMITGVALYLAFEVRFEGAVPPVYATQLRVLLPIVIVGRLATNAFLGMYRLMWRYVSIVDAIRIARTYAVFSGLLIVLRLSLPGEAWTLLRLPLSVIAIEFLLSFTGSCGVRLLRRIRYERRQLQPEGRGNERRLLLVGAGSIGATVAKELSKHPGIRVVGFVVDDPKKVGANIAGVKVLDSLANLSVILKEEKVEEVLICIRPTARDTLVRLWHICDRLAIPTRIVPTISEILETTSSISVLREIAEGKNGQTSKHTSAPPPPLPVAPAVQGKTILITGGAGFVGSSLAEKLVAENRVILFDRSFELQPVCFTSLLEHPNVRAVEGNILEEPTLQSLAQEADIVVHMAAVVGVQKVRDSARETLETNFVGTSRLFQALQSSRRLQRLLYFSTSEVFGVNSFRVTEDSSPVVGSISDARWSYATAKLAGEHLAKAYFREFGTPVVIVRPFNVFGPRRLGEHAILRFVANALAGRPIEVHGDGSQIRSWCYIEDFCTALLTMLTSREAVGEDFNIGNPKNTLTIYQLACEVMKVANTTVDIVFTGDSLPDVNIRVPSLEKARRRLGYEPIYGLDESLRLTVEWYRNNWEYLTKRLDPVGVRS